MLKMRISRRMTVGHSIVLMMATCVEGIAQQSRGERHPSVRRLVDYRLQYSHHVFRQLFFFLIHYISSVVIYYFVNIVTFASKRFALLYVF